MLEHKWLDGIPLARLFGTKMTHDQKRILISAFLVFSALGLMPLRISYDLE
jgi:hypothetical protein